jgi:hypothetical protein
MISDNDYWPTPCPFWYVPDKLLAGVLGIEINAVTELLAKYPDVRNLFDAPGATVPQRTVCFLLLAHRKLMGIIYETFAGRYEQSPSLGEAESHALSQTQSLVAADSPAWVLEVNEIVELLPSRIFGALPVSLRSGGFDSNNSAQVDAIKSAIATLSNIEQIQAFVGKVLDQQLGRLERRWSATVAPVPEPIAVKSSKRPLRGVEGLAQKAIDLSRYMDNLTEKQRLAFSLKFEYELGLAEIASRMEVDRKTAYEHIDAAQRKIDQTQSNEKHKARAKNTPE